MRKTVLFRTLVLLMLALPMCVRAQDAGKSSESPKAAEPAPHYYHLVFAVQELDANGKPTNSRTYSTSVSTDRGFIGSVRTGSKVPVATGLSSINQDVQFTRIDIGVNFDLQHVVEMGRNISLDLSAEISSIATAEDARLHQPVIRQNRWHAPVIIPIGKPTVVFSSDSLDSKGSLQVTVTATPLQ